MIRKSGHRFSEKIMLKQKRSMVRKSGNRFSEKIMLKLEKLERDADPTKTHPALKAKSSMARV
jgi:hypothetical protein